MFKRCFRDYNTQNHYGEARLECLWEKGDKNNFPKKIMNILGFKKLGWENKETWENKEYNKILEKFKKTRFYKRHMLYWISLVLWNQWGDEGKWKITDFLVQISDVVIRFNGWHNAGHTVKVWDKEYDLHILPSWVVSEWKINIITSGCVLWIDLNKVDLDKFEIINGRNWEKTVVCNHRLEEILKIKDWEKLRVGLIPEIEKLERGGIDIKKSNIKISGETKVIWIHNVLLDAHDELVRKAVWLRKIWSTGSGISRTYASEDLRYHFTLNDLLYNSELYYKSIQALWLSYKHLFPYITADELIIEAEKEREKIIKYINDGKLEIIQDEKNYIKKLHKEGNKIVWEWAQSSMIWSWNSIYWTASNPSLQSFMDITWLTVKKIGNIFLIHKDPPSSVWERPWFLKEDTTEELNNFREKYSEKWVSTWRWRDIFKRSIVEMARWAQLNIKGIDDESKIVPVFNRMDALEDSLKISEWILEVVKWYINRVNNIVWEKVEKKVWIHDQENLITPDNLLRNYPEKSEQEFWYDITKEDLKIIKIEGTTLEEKKETLLRLYLAAIFRKDKKREYLVWTWPKREDLDLRTWVPLRKAS